MTHVLGHTEKSDFTVPITNSDFMTNVQSVAAAMTFAKRSALLNALGITTGDEDTDATTVNKEPDVKSLKSKVIFLLRSLGENSADKAIMQVEVERLTGLKLEDVNLSGIIEK